MSSSYDVGDNFECLVLSRLRHSLNPNFSRPRPMPGDRGKDITGAYHGFSVVVQCKDLAGYHHRTVLGVFVISHRCRYTQEAISYAASSTFNLVLSTETSIINDIQRFRAGPEGIISQQILEEVRKNLGKVCDLEERIRRLEVDNVELQRRVLRGNIKIQELKDSMGGQLSNLTGKYLNTIIQ
ncbi:hypothetical protein Glove_120g211 [Diversispora epigaea]|uniref:Uncharacterized protein n=1 Tax=Diversispora epigaea TaxID=1348612 RepID=A0A397J8L5_9GLOM|nr:hypothetical protein Glove_120g211 [Diversispora epigaea]